MLRITEYIKDSLNNKEIRSFNGSILIWNLTNLCNLACEHCYASAQNYRKEELSLEEIFNIIPQLKKENVGFVILSGGEPLVRKDIYTIATELRKNKIRTYLSTNGLLVNENNIEKIRDHFDYLGISIDGTPDIHDKFRGQKGAYHKSMKAIRLGLQHQMKVGLRFTLAPTTYDSLPYIFELVERENIPKIYISHLVYAGRGGLLSDLDQQRYCDAVKFIMKKSFEYVGQKTPIDIVTGNNEADAVILLEEFSKRFPDFAANMKKRLETWGGNQAGARLVNIDYQGNVKPDPFFPETAGNIKERSFTDIWNTSPLLQKLREHPRQLKGDCQDCSSLAICNGNSRARSYAVYGDYWETDPACYLSYWAAG